MKTFTLVSASSLPEAARESARPRTLLKAGGVDVLDRLKEGLDSPDRLVSIGHIPGHDEIVMGPPARIGALATLAGLASNRDILRIYPALAHAAGEAATPQIRNMATLGGNLCQKPRCWYYRNIDFTCRKKGGQDCFALEGENRFHAIFDTNVCCCVHPSATGTALLAYGAQVETVSPRGKRAIPIDDFFTLPTKDVGRENALEPGEIVEAVVIPEPPPGARSAYRKFKEKETFDWPLAEACVHVTVSGGAIREARVVLGSVAPVPRRAKKAEAMLIGAKASPDLIRRAAEAAVEGATPLGQNAYKVRLARVMVERALKEALA